MLYFHFSTLQIKNPKEKIVKLKNLVNTYNGRNKEERSHSNDTIHGTWSSNTIPSTSKKNPRNNK
jgi:hypothetical protein